MDLKGQLSNLKFQYKNTSNGIKYANSVIERITEEFNPTAVQDATRYVSPSQKAYEKMKEDVKNWSK